MVDYMLCVKSVGDGKHRWEGVREPLGEHDRKTMSSIEYGCCQGCVEATNNPAGKFQSGLLVGEGNELLRWVKERR